MADSEARSEFKKKWDAVEVPSRDDAIAFLKNRDWYEYYNPEYWVNDKNVADKSRQDPTNYGMDVDSAYRFEVLGLPPFEPCGFPILSMMAHAVQQVEGATDET